MHISEATADAADNYIVEHCGENDVAVTRDIPLASRLVEKGITVLNDRGVVYIRTKIYANGFRFGISIWNSTKTA